MDQRTMEAMAVAALILLMKDDVDTLLACLRSTGLVLLLSSAACVLTSLLLAELRRRFPNSRLAILFIFIHFLPLFIPPVLLVATVTIHLEIAHYVMLAQSRLLLAAFGFIFHSGIAFALIFGIFNWNERIDQVRRLSINLASRRSTRTGILMIQIYSPLAFTFAAVFVMQESMISAPFFTGRYTLLSVTQELIQSSTGGAQWELPLLFVASIASVFLLSYLLPRFVGTLLLRRIARLPGLRETPSLLQRHIALPWSKTSLFIVSAILATPNLAIVIVAMLMISSAAHGSTFADSLGLLGTMTSIPVCLGVGSFLLLLAFATLRTPNTNNRSSYIDIQSMLALLPPALLGTIGLVMIRGPLSRDIILYLCAGFYAYLMMKFFVNPTALGKERFLFRNAQLCRLPLKRIGWVALSSKIGGTLPVALVALYFLWIEDGIQVTIVGHSNDLASRVRGLKVSQLQSSIYSGALITFVAWLLVLALSYAVSSRRFTWVSRALASSCKSAVVPLAVVLVLLSAPPQALSVQRTGSDRVAISRCDLKDRVLSPGHGASLLVPGCAAGTIDNVEVYVSSAHIVVPKAVNKLRISHLIFHWPESSLYIEKDSAGGPVQLEIGDVQNAGDSTSSEIRFQNIHIGRLIVRGERRGNSDMSLQDGPSIIFMAGSSVEDTHLHNLSAPNIELISPNSADVSIHLDDIVTHSIYIHRDFGVAEDGTHEGAQAAFRGSLSGDPTEPRVADFTATDVHVMGSDSDPGRVSVEGIRFAGGSLELSGHGRTQIQFLHDTIEADSTSVVRLRGGTSGDNAELRAEDIHLNGKLDIEVTDGALVGSAIMDTIRSDHRTDDSTLAVKTSHFETVKLSDLALFRLRLCGELGPGPQLDFNARNVTVYGDVSVPSALLANHWNAEFRAAERTQFLRTLQERGDFCETGAPIGVDALYQRKKLELQEAHPIVSILVDALSGFGVRLSHALFTFVCIVLLHFTLRAMIILIETERKKSDAKKRWAAVKSALAGTLTMREHGTHEGGYQACLEAVRLCCGWVIFAQITLCSIYLGQTTLQ